MTPAAMPRRLSHLRKRGETLDLRLRFARAPLFGFFGLLRGCFDNKFSFLGWLASCGNNHPAELLQQSRISPPVT